jgi:hypothetical protein
MAQNHNADYSEKPMTRDGRIQGPSRRYRRLRHPIFQAALWTAKNPLLQRGEIGFEIDTHKAKVGDGVTYWNDLPYSFVAETEWGSITGDITNQTDLVDFVDGKVATEAGLRADADDALQGQITANKDTMDDHIANTNNPHSVTASQVGLGNVDNTSDADKPISTATQTALDTKADETNLINGAPLSNTSSKFFGVSSTAAATAQKEVSIPSITSLEAGIVIIVQPTVTSTVTNSTLKLNSFDAYPMRYNNAAITTSTDSVVWSASFPSIWVFDGAYWVFAGHGLDSNTTYTLNYSVDAGQYTAGSGTYAVTRYSILAQKADGTWEKITATNANYSTGTSKSVNTSGFILNQLRYYGTTTTVTSGVKIATNVLYEKAASVDMRYSTNCGGTTTWALGDYIYLVGTIGADRLFYLDTTTWWSNALPTTNDGKLYIRLGLSLTAAGYTMSFFDDRPIFYHDGTGIKEYKVADNKQDVISDLATIRSGASAGATAVQPGDLATVATTGSYNDLSDKPTIPAAQVNSDWNANSGVAQILNKPTLGTMAAESASDYTKTSGLAAVATSGAYSDLTGKPTIPTTLAALTGDVSISSPVSGEHLVYDGSKWKNTTSSASVSWGGITGTLSDQTDLQNALNAKQDTLTAGTNINITGTTISATDTTYTGSDGVTLTGTNFTNSGVRAVATGTTSGTVSVNTNGTSTDVAVNGWANKADDNAVVHLTGAETIMGSKTFQDARMTQEITSGSYLDFYQYIDGDRRGAMRTFKDSNDANHYYTVFGNCGPNAEAPQGVTVHRNASTTWATAPSSDAANSIVTTIDKSKSTNGYFKFGNGLIVQWGQNNASNAGTTITLPTAFTSATSYEVAVVRHSSTAGETASANQTSGSAFVITTSNSNSRSWGWIAIGY